MNVFKPNASKRKRKQIIGELKQICKMKLGKKKKAKGIRPQMPEDVV